MRDLFDHYTVLPEPADLKKIQEQIHKNSKYLNCKTIEDAEKVYTICALISFDEGYRKAVSDLSELGINIKLKRRKRGEALYAPIDDVLGLSGLIKFREKSEKQLNEFKSHIEELGKEFWEEEFLLSIVIHTAFEIGYLKGFCVNSEFGGNDD